MRSLNGAGVRRLALAVVLASPILMGLDACTELKIVTGQDDSAGVYKGPVDPLTEQSASDRAEVLSDRLQLIQAR